jgi:hypothetical protein
MNRTDYLGLTETALSSVEGAEWIAHPKSQMANLKS